MQILKFLLVVTFSSSIVAGINYQGDQPKIWEGDQFSDLWDKVSTDSYNKLPQYKTSFSSLFSWGVSHIKKAANRTLNSRENFIDEFTKLAHPNGICLKGTWEIDGNSPYTGYFKQGSKGLIIARASTAMSDTKRGKNRAFGFAGKVFPTTDEYDLNKYDPANFFLVDDLGGTKAEHYTDVSLTNEPAVSKNGTVVANILYVTALFKAFSAADKNPGMRQIYEIAELGLEQGETAVTPKWMELKAREGQTVDEEDFRDELKIDNYNGELVFDIRVANTQTESGVKNWTRVGTITLNESVVTKSCDRRLHFHHPKWRDDLNYGVTPDSNQKAVVNKAHPFVTPGKDPIRLIFEAQ